PNEVERRQPESTWIDDAQHPIICLVVKTLTDYFAGKKVDFSLIPCQPEGSEFQKSVWHQLKKMLTALWPEDSDHNTERLGQVF
ncbi:MAG: hypothetical protein ACK5M5_12395, partial [Limnobaculum xujianqingii]